jgi:hypothetical protein
MASLLCAGVTGAQDQPITAIERGLRFLLTDAAKWRKERQCATCHHGALTVWALSEARSRGFAVDAAALADISKWTKERLKDIDKPRDTRPGWNMVNSVAVYLSVMAQVVPKQKVLNVEERKQIAGHLLRHQEADGSWAWSLAPAKNRPPPFFESDEVVTLLASMALAPHADAKTGRDKASAWLTKHKPNDTTQAEAFRLLAQVQARAKPDVIQQASESLLRRQNKDGGWSQLKELRSDAYATGQALYVLSLAGFKHDGAEIRRGVAFLVAQQKDDGSWPMKQRAHEGVKPGTNAMPLIYFGSAWATLGLMRSVPR